MKLAYSFMLQRIDWPIGERSPRATFQRVSRIGEPYQPDTIGTLTLTISISMAEQMRLDFNKAQIFEFRLLPEPEPQEPPQPPKPWHLSKSTTAAGLPDGCATGNDNLVWRIDEGKEGLRCVGYVEE